MEQMYVKVLTEGGFTAPTQWESRLGVHGYSDIQK